MKKNFFYYLAPSIVRLVTGFFLIPFTTYYLDPLDFGVVAILTAISALVAPLSSTGAPWVLAAHFYTVGKEEKGILLFNQLFLEVVLKFFWCLAFSATAAIYLPGILSEYRPQYLYYYQLALLGVFFSDVWNTLSYILVLQTRARMHASIEIGQQLVTLIAIVICLKSLGMGLPSMFVAPLASGVYVFAVGLWVLRRDIRIRLSARWASEILRIGMPSIPLNVFEIITNTIDRFFIQRWLSLSNLGIYSHSRTYQSMFSMGKRAFNLAFAPELLETYAKTKDPERLNQILTLWYGLLGLCGTFVVLFSDEMISFLTHGKFTAAATLVPIWFLLTISHTFGIPYSQYLSFRRKTPFMVKSGILINAVFIGVNALAIYYFGILGAAVTVLLSNLVTHVVRRIYAIRIGGKRIAEDKFLLVLLFLVTLYCFVRVTHLSLYFKVTAFFGIALFFSCAFRLFAELRKTFPSKLWEKLS